MSDINASIDHAQGEIDIVEGVNGKGPNQSTLHTSASECFNNTIDVLLLILLQIVLCHQIE